MAGASKIAVQSAVGIGLATGGAIMDLLDGITAAPEGVMVGGRPRGPRAIGSGDGGSSVGALGGAPASSSSGGALSTVASVLASGVFSGKSSSGTSDSDLQGMHVPALEKLVRTLRYQSLDYTSTQITAMTKPNLIALIKQLR